MIMVQTRTKTCCVARNGAYTLDVEAEAALFFVTTEDAVSDPDRERAKKTAWDTVASVLRALDKIDNQILAKRVEISRLETESNKWEIDHEPMFNSPLSLEDARQLLQNHDQLARARKELLALYEQRKSSAEPVPCLLRLEPERLVGVSGNPKLALELAEQELVTAATNRVLLSHIAGIEPAYAFDERHPWTQRLRTHPHLTIVREHIVNALIGNAILQAKQLSGSDPFNLNTLSTKENIKWLAADAVSWLYGEDAARPFCPEHDRAFLFGSFRLEWVANKIEYSSDFPNFSSIAGQSCVHAQVAFHASDVARLGSATRIPKTNTSLLPDNPFGMGRPFQNVSLRWDWTEQICHEY